MQSVELYTKSTCGFCHAAKRLLTSKGVSFSEVDIGRKPDKRAEMIQRAKGGSTVPQIFIGKTHVGGADDLFALEKAGKLDALFEGMKAALLQLTSSDDPARNLGIVREMMRDAAGQGARFILTPEVTNCVSASRAHQQVVLRHEADDLTLAGLCAEAKALGVWLSIGSLALKTDDPDGRFANRSFMIDPKGQIVARYDKIHMFDVDVSATETYRESAGYRPGTRAVLADTAFGKVGLSICYDLRFAYLYRALAQVGADILIVPSAFSPVTGAAHWQALLQARAIETGCYVLAAAQVGMHQAELGKSRETYGHSMAISPWGEVLVDAGVEKTIEIIDINLEEVSSARKRIAALTHDRPFEGP